MDLRLIELTLELSRLEGIRSKVEEHRVKAIWSRSLHDGLCLLSVVVPANEVESITDDLAGLLSSDSRFRAVVTGVEAVIPVPEESNDEPEEKASVGTLGKKNKATGRNRISREELYGDIEPGTRLSSLYLLTTFLSALVAAVGLIRDDVAVVIGAMVIAPLLTPNMALALATTLGDTKLAWEAMKSNVGGASLALGVSFLIGLIFPLSMDAGQIMSRTTTGLSDVVLAACAGTAGALAFTSGVPAALIGVMVAVALLPPLVCLGLLLAANEWNLALGAFCLLVINVSCVNLTAVSTFLVQGIRPMKWWEANKARKASRVALLFWSLILVILIAAILLKPQVES